MIAYKVVRQTRGGKFISSWIDATGFCLEYKVGEKREPEFKGSKLFVFKNIEDARHYKTIIGGGIIFECKVPYLSRITKMAKGWPEALQDFWMCKKKHKKPQDKYLVKTVPGAYQTSHLTLIKAV